jgi:Flp pilus assembly protein TadG
MVTCTATLNSLAAAYAGYGSWIGLASGAPGTSATPSSEATGGAPAYARKNTTWSAGTTGVQNGTAQTIDVAAATYTYVIVASTSSGNSMVDNATITGVTMGAQGQIVVTPTYTQT